MSTKEEKTKKTTPQQEIDETLRPEFKLSEETMAESNLSTTIDRLQRLQAEFENYKKRALRDASVYEQRVSDRLILEFLPLYDNLQRAFQSFASNQDVDTLVTGTEQIFGQFKQVLENMDVKPIHVENQRFDPAIHEAMLGVASDIEKNMIVEEFMPGYMRDERVLRPSRVSVSQGPALNEEEPK